MVTLERYIEEIVICSFINNRLNISKTCKELDISRSTFYNIVSMQKLYKIKQTYAYVTKID